MTVERQMVDKKQNNSEPVMLPLAGIKVWLVEADESTLKLYLHLLREAGAVVECFEGVSIAVEHMQDFGHVTNDASWTPEIILVDLVLPDDSGVTVVECARKIWPSVPVLAYASFAKVEDAVCALQAGACNFIRKPVHLGDLVVEVEKALKQEKFLRHHRSLEDSLRILNVARSIASVSDRKDLLKAFLRALAREVKLSEGFAFLYDAHLTFPEFLLDLRQGGVSRREPFEFVQNNVLPVLNEKKTIAHLPAVAPHAAMIKPEISISHDHRFVIIDFGSQSGNRGIVAFSAKDRSAEQLCRDLQPLGPLVEQASVSFQNLDTVASMLLVDELTGLYNQRFMKVSLSQELARCQRYGGHVSLIFIDLDRFKSINDTHGHLVGSEMIKTAARILKASVRDSDYLLRYGGDEFCTILPNTPLEGAMTLAERIRESFEKSVLDLSSMTGVGSANAIHVTTSIGVASYPQCAGSANELVKAADAAMYESKRAGRNRISMFRPLSTK